MIPKVTQNDVIGAIEATPDLSFYVFTAGFGNIYWDNIVTSSTKTKMFDLTPSAEQMYGNLLSILDETACGEN